MHVVGENEAIPLVEQAMNDFFFHREKKIATNESVLV